MNEQQLNDYLDFVEEVYEFIKTAALSDEAKTEHLRKMVKSKLISAYYAGALDQLSDNFKTFEL